MSKSRASQSVKNAKIALLFYFINLLLNFVSRKSFIDYLGIEVLGLNTTITNLLQFLNIAELGISAAISYSLYKPLYEKDRSTVNEIVSVQGWFYRQVALVVIIGSCVLLPFFPFIFKGMELPLWYAYASFVVLSLNSLLGYFVNYKQIVLVADQKEYKVSFCVQGGKNIKIILQIIAITLLFNGYIYWLILECIMPFIIASILSLIIKKEYPWLTASATNGQSIRRKYSEIVTKTKQLFFHRISLVVLGQVTPIIIYVYTSLSVVAIYGNYMLIMGGGITFLVKAIFDSLSAGIGNLVAEGDKKKILNFYWEYISVRFWFVSVLCFGLLMLTQSFMELWLGEKYVLTQVPFILLISYTFIFCTRMHETFLAAYGLYKDIWAPILETVLNIGCSFWFGYYWGLNGIIAGVTLSIFLIGFIWKPYFLFKTGFKLPVKEYVKVCFKVLGIIGISFVVSFYIYNFLFCIGANNFWKWGIKAIVSTSIYVIISTVLFLLYIPSFSSFLKRLNIRRKFQL